MEPQLRSLLGLRGPNELGESLVKEGMERLHFAKGIPPANFTDVWKKEARGGFMGSQARKSISLFEAEIFYGEGHVMPGTLVHFAIASS